MNNNTFVCKVFKLNISNIDEIRCFFATLHGYAFYYDFGYICMVPLAIIILLSIFGGIKEVYRWFILNQAIWDFVLCYELSCTKAYLVKDAPKCFFNVLPPNFPEILVALVFWLAAAFVSVPYHGLLLLSLSRYIALYWNPLYKRLTKKWKILFVIAFFNALSLIFCSSPLIAGLVSARIKQLNLDCNEQNLTKADCSIKVSSDGLTSFYLSFINILQYLFTLMQPIQLSISIFAAFMIILKLLKQSKFQFKHNRKDFLNSFRICIVIFLQNLITLFIFLNVSVQRVREIYNLIFQKPLIWNSPLWIDGRWGLGSTDLAPLINLIRVFIESIVFLFIMTGYREALWKFIKSVYFCFKNPAKSWKELRFSSTNVTIIASSRTH